MKSFARGVLVSILVLACSRAVIASGKGNLRYSITVSKFDNESGWHGQWHVGDGFAAILTEALNESDNFIVLGEAEMREASMREQDLAAGGRMAGGKKAPKMGRMTPAQLLVRGSVTHVQHSTGGGSVGIGFKGIRLGGDSDRAEVNITIYLVDSETGQVAASTKVVGKSNRRGMNIGYHGSKLGGLTGDLAGFKKDNVGKACEDAVGQAVEFLTQQLEDVRWEGTVVLASGDKVVINRGEREGVEVGNEFTVGTSEELVDPDTGEVLDVEISEVGKIKVTEVKEKIAYCKPISGGEAVEKGMSVFPVD